MTQVLISWTYNTPPTSFSFNLGPQFRQKILWKAERIGNIISSLMESLFYFFWNGYGYAWPSSLTWDVFFLKWFAMPDQGPLRLWSWNLILQRLLYFFAFFTQPYKKHILPSFLTLTLPWLGRKYLIFGQTLWYLLVFFFFGTSHDISITGWWFGTFFIFPYIGNNNPNWLIFFRGVAQPPTRLVGSAISFVPWHLDWQWLGARWGMVGSP